MAFAKQTKGTYGARVPVTLMKWMRPMLTRMHRRSGNTYQGMQVLYLHTVGAKSGKLRTTPVAYLPDGDSWLITASVGGAAHHPDWYHNIAAHPDNVAIDLGGHPIAVHPTQLQGAERDEAFTRIAAAMPNFGDYQSKTDRILPVIRLTRA